MTLCREREGSCVKYVYVFESVFVDLSKTQNSLFAVICAGRLKGPSNGPLL